MNALATNEHTIRQPYIAQELDVLRRTVEELISVKDKLVERLTPITYVRPQETADKEKEQEQPVIMARDIRKIRTDIAAVRDHLMLLASQIEL